MTDAPRVRMSPSPTGYFHVGGARTTLFNWLFARRKGGTFILRIEDTDEARNHPEWTEGIYEALRWLGLAWDEGPYFQSASADRHRSVATNLFRAGKAYWCDCPAEAVEARKKAAGEKTPGYDRHCRDRGLAAGDGRALRFRTPREGSLHRVDLIRGESDIDYATIEDFTLLRGNGTPLFILANIIDDLDQRITHVIRAEEHLSNVPKALLLWGAVVGPDGPKPPAWAHVPMIVNEQRKKLSKRRPGDKVAVELYRDEGILPEAMVNYLATLGWSPPEEICPLDKMIEVFDLADVVSASAQFDEKKLRAFNGEYIRAMSTAEFVDRSLEWYRTTVVEPMAPLLQERSFTLADGVAMTDFFVVDEPAMDRRDWDKDMTKGPARELLGEAIVGYADLIEWTATSLHEATAAIGEHHGLTLGKAQRSIRVAITGRSVGPPLFESMAVLGRDRVLARLRRALDRLPPPG